MADEFPQNVPNLSRLILQQPEIHNPFELLSDLEPADPENTTAGLRAIQTMQQFWSCIPDDHIPIVLVDGALKVQVLDVTLVEPALLFFEGFTEDFRKVRVLQHVSRLSVTMMSVPRQPNEARRELGFHVQREP